MIPAESIINMKHSLSLPILMVLRLKVLSAENFIFYNYYNPYLNLSIVWYFKCLKNMLNCLLGDQFGTFGQFGTFFKPDNWLACL